MNERNAHPSGSVTTSAFDAGTLVELQDLFGRTRLMELLGVLDGEIASRLDRQTPETGQLARDAHALVSSSGALAFHDLSKACVALEQACLSGADIGSALTTARDAAREARAAIATLQAA